MKEEKYQQYVNSLTERIRTCDGILQQVIERQRLVEFAESLRSKLNYFDELENVSLELEPLDHWCFFDEKTKDCAKMNNSGEESDNPIRYPCTCSGSIKFVHPDSLLELRLYQEESNTLFFFVYVSSHVLDLFASALDQDYYIVFLSSQSVNKTSTHISILSALNGR
ncbi:hypothetical protein SSX86_007252 [Deinandra increscens subsp. villosa]|uniref:RING-CH-type domain-containing protein n=1 Tax=Deinandra increscens subsp. villosa TaxID=3103831 RepID=A0AAP0H6C6_9ASTR